MQLLDLSNRLAPTAAAFYQTEHATRAQTQSNFAQAGLQASIALCDYLHQQTPPARLIILAGVARAGLGLLTPQLFQLWQQNQHGAHVMGLGIGASRQSNAAYKPAKIYWSGNWAAIQDYVALSYVAPPEIRVIVFEYGLATASTAEAVLPVIWEKLPGIPHQNITLFAQCVCWEQSQARLAALCSRATLAAGSLWHHTEIGNSQGLPPYYLYQMHTGNGSWQEHQPRDWGQCCFGEGWNTVYPHLHALGPWMPLSESDHATIAAHTNGH